VRRVAIAFLITASTVGGARAQTPYPVPVQEEPKPRPVPVPVEGEPTPTPVPVDGEPKPTPVPVRDNPNAPVPIDQAPPPPPAGQQPPSGPQPKPTPVAPAPAPTQPGPAPAPAPAPAPKPPPPPDLKLQKRAELPPEQINPPLAADLTGSAEIKKIVVDENTKTTSDTVEVLSGLEVGDTWTPDMIDVVKTRLVSSGLFKDVEVYWTMEPGGVAIHILAKDKHSWVIAPAFYNQPTNVGGGIGFGENNLFGQNQKLLLYGQVATGDTFFIGAWVIPALWGSRFYAQFDTYLKSGRNIEYTSPTTYLVDEGDVRPVRESRIHYLNFGAKLGVELFRGLRIDTRLRGASVRYKDIKIAEGATIEDIQPGGDPTMPPAPGKEGSDVSNEISLTLDRRANWYGVQEGKKYSVTLERSLTSLGSDFDYWLLTVSGFKAYKVLARHNLVFKGDVKYGNNLPFQQEFLTGGTSMRGWLNNEFRGDFRVLGNVEYSVPVFTIKGFSVRGLAFWDTAYTTFLKTTQNTMDGTRHYLPGAQVRGLDGFKNSVGVGTRFYLRQIVLPLLGLDFGYGLEARDFQIYLAIGLTD
jgi:outer membrane protein insertion porin family